MRGHEDDMTLGDLLYDARRQLGESVDAASAATRIPARAIEAFEHDDYGSLPPKSYALNMLGAYSRHLGVDAGYARRLFERDCVEGAGSRRGSDKPPRRNRPIDVSESRYVEPMGGVGSAGVGGGTGVGAGVGGGGDYYRADARGQSRAPAYRSYADPMPEADGTRSDRSAWSSRVAQSARRARAERESRGGWGESDRSAGGGSGADGGRSARNAWDDESDRGGRSAGSSRYALGNREVGRSASAAGSRSSSRRRARGNDLTWDDSIYDTYDRDPFAPSERAISRERARRERLQNAPRTPEWRSDEESERAGDLRGVGFAREREERRRNGGILGENPLRVIIPVVIAAIIVVIAIALITSANASNQAKPSVTVAASAASTQTDSTTASSASSISTQTGTTTTVSGEQTTARYEIVVPQGKTSDITVVLDGEEAYSGTAVGPVAQTYTASKNISITFSSTSGITLSKDGNPVTIEDAADGGGTYEDTLSL